MQGINLDELKLVNLGIDKTIYGRIFSFVDFGNINRWYEKYRGEFEGKILKNEEKLIVDVIKLGKFVDLFSIRKFFYYGFDYNMQSSLHIKILADKVAKFTPVSKPIQWIKHYLTNEEMEAIAGIDPGSEDLRKGYILIPKCNFDVEIAIDAIRLVEKYDTFVLFSSDSDFRALLDYLNKLGKKIILVYSGPTSSDLKNLANLKITGSQIRETVCMIKQSSRI